MQPTEDCQSFEKLRKTKDLSDYYFNHYLGGETPFKLENLSKYLGGAQIWCKDVSAINADAHKVTVNALICKESEKIYCR